MPVRIQRRRTKGYRLPAGAIYVGRPSRWGNPFTVAGGYTPEEAVAVFRLYAAVERATNPQWLDPLYGKSLACWCRPGAPCHADVLLELVNLIAR